MQSLVQITRMEHLMTHPSAFRPSQRTAYNVSKVLLEAPYYWMLVLFSYFFGRAGCSSDKAGSLAQKSGEWRLC